MIRPLRESDLDRVMEIWLEGNLSAHPGLPAEYWKQSSAAVREALPKANVLIYECFAQQNHGQSSYTRCGQGYICGFIGVQDGYIAGLFVDGCCRGKGVGSRLLRSAICRLGARSLDVYDENKSAINFYLRHNFQITDTHTDENTGALEHSMAFVE